MTTAPTLDERMCAYEAAFDHVLPQRMPIVAHVDGIGFSQLTKGCKKHFDKNLGDLMLTVAERLMRRIQGAEIVYTQSDEMTILIHGYKKFSSQPYRGNRVQKLISELAGGASAYFTEGSSSVFTLDDDGPPLFVTVPGVFAAKRKSAADSKKEVEAARQYVQSLCWTKPGSRQLNPHVDKILREVINAPRGGAWQDAPHSSMVLAVMQTGENLYRRRRSSGKEQHWYLKTVPNDDGTVTRELRFVWDGRKFGGFKLTMKGTEVTSCEPLPE